ncbi:MAG: hypothetical protein Kapaf2KO_14590 [Candidatus Kapaibacteriales bacterium]
MLTKANLTIFASILIITSCASPSILRKGDGTGFYTNSELSEPKKHDFIADNQNHTFDNNDSLNQSNSSLFAEKMLSELEANTQYFENDSEVQDEETLKNSLTPLKKQLEAIKETYLNQNEEIVQNKIQTTKNGKELKKLKSEISLIDQRLKKIETVSSEKTTKSKVVRSGIKADPKPNSNKPSRTQNQSKFSKEVNYLKKLIDTGNHEKAKETLKSIDKSNLTVLEHNTVNYCIGEIAFSADEYKEALSQFKSIEGKFDDNDKVKSRIAECYLKLGKTDKAKSAYKDIVENNPKSRYVPIARKMLQQL